MTRFFRETSLRTIVKIVEVILQFIIAYKSIQTFFSSSLVVPINSWFRRSVRLGNHVSVKKQNEARRLALYRQAYEDIRQKVNVMFIFIFALHIFFCIENYE